MVQAFCRCIEDLGSFVAHELLTTREVEPVVDLATEGRVGVSLAVDVADLSAEAFKEKVIFLVVEAMVISLVTVEKAGVSLAIDVADLSAEAFEEMVIF